MPTCGHHILTGRLKSQLSLLVPRLCIESEWERLGVVRGGGRGAGGGQNADVFDLRCAAVPPPQEEIKEPETALSSGLGIPQQPL